MQQQLEHEKRSTYVTLQETDVNLSCKNENQIYTNGLHTINAPHIGVLSEVNDVSDGNALGHQDKNEVLLGSSSEEGDCCSQAYHYSFQYHLSHD